MWNDPPPKSDESWSPDGSVQMTTWQEPQQDSTPPSPKIETPPPKFNAPRSGLREAEAKQNRPREKPPVADTDPAPPRAEQKEPDRERSRLRPPFRRSTDSFLARLTRTPDMFGDFNTPSVTQVRLSGGQNFSGDLIADIPGAGATRSFKNEHSRALPTDRVFFFYNHFHNAVSVNSPFGSDQVHVNQYTIGAESTFDNGNWSVELRMPFAGDMSIDNGFASGGSNGTGNLAVTVRKLLHIDQHWVISSGLATTTRTGDDATFDFGGRQITVDNSAVHLVPFLAFQVAAENNWFFHAFWQVDVPAGEDGITVFAPGQFIESDDIHHQVLMFLDLASGYWWHRSTYPNATGLTGIASVVELHYTTALKEADVSQPGLLDIGNLNNRVAVVNLTLGLHTEWNENTNLRLAAVIPLRDAQSNRFFDSEFQASLIRRY